MLPGLASNRQAKGATTTTPVPTPTTAVNSTPEASVQLDASIPNEKATPAEKSDEPIEPDEEFYRFYGITPREREIIAYLMRGRSVPYIRDELFISQNTVKTHIKHIYAKTNVGSRQELLDLIESMRP
jgi:DNA-binding NarL/FixJ family response regulator